MRAKVKGGTSEDMPKRAKNSYNAIPVVPAPPITTTPGERKTEGRQGVGKWSPVVRSLPGWLHTNHTPTLLPPSLPPSLPPFFPSYQSGGKRTREET
jgi:hypothetical protein